jgi:hypothetical protein
MTPLIRDRAAVEAVVNLLCAGKQIAAFSYAAGFTVTLEGGRRPNVPATAILYWASTVSTARVAMFHAVRPVPAIHVDEFVPLIAYELATAIGSTVERLLIADDGTLTLRASDDHIFVIQGVDADVEESWNILPPPDVGPSEEWSVTCDSGGKLFARGP